jgi:sterol carrier protein 2
MMCADEFNGNGSNRLGYNHAYQCRPVTLADVDKVKSKKSSEYVIQAARL